MKPSYDELLKTLEATTDALNEANETLDAVFELLDSDSPTQHDSILEEAFRVVESAGVYMDRLGDSNWPKVDSAIENFKTAFAETVKEDLEEQAAEKKIEVSIPRAKAPKKTAKPKAKPKLKAVKAKAPKAAPAVVPQAAVIEEPKVEAPKVISVTSLSALRATLKPKVGAS